jgi:anti-anti-sigma factor
VQAAGARPPVVVLSGEWDAADVGLDEILVDQLRANDGRLVVDMLNVTFIDSAVVRACVAAHRESSKRSGWVRLVYTHHVIRRVVEICGLTEVFPQFASVEAALRGHERHGGEMLAVEEGRAR